MPPPSRFAAGNRLLQTLSANDHALLQRDLEPIDLAVRYSLELPKKSIEHVYFLDAGIASVVAIQEGVETEIGLISCEGMTGSSVVLGTGSSPHSTYIQVAGAGRRMKARNLVIAMKESDSLRPMLLKFVQAFMVQTAHTAIANAHAKLTERLARWLLMAHDRITGDDLPLTHEFLSLMLAVRRAGVTETLNALKVKSMIRCARGVVTIIDRKGIEKIAGGFYGVPEAEYRRLFA